jgi:hypothetical protein
MGSHQSSLLLSLSWILGAMRLKMHAVAGFIRWRFVLEWKRGHQPQQEITSVRLNRVLASCNGEVCPRISGTGN